MSYQQIGNSVLNPSNAAMSTTVTEQAAFDAVQEIEAADFMNVSGDFGSLTLGDENVSLTQILGITANPSASGGLTHAAVVAGDTVTVLDEGGQAGGRKGGGVGTGLALPNVQDLSTIDVRALGHSEDSMKDLLELIKEDSQPKQNAFMHPAHVQRDAPAMVVVKQEAVEGRMDYRRKRPHEQSAITSEIDLKRRLLQMQLDRHHQLVEMGLVPAAREGRQSQPVLRITNQPYPCQKKRYKTDGPKRGIIKSATGNEFPSVQIDGYGGTADVVAYAATSSSDPHPFYDIEVAPDNYSAQMTSLNDGTPCVKVRIDQPTNGMKAVFSGISTKRLKLREVKAKLGYDRWLNESETVHLGFLAFIPTGDNPQIVLNGLSQSIDVYDALPELPVLRKIIPLHGTWEGGFEMCLVGQHFSGARVRFYEIPGGDQMPSWEEIALQDPQDCTETHLVVKVPHCPAHRTNLRPIQVNVEVITGPVKIPRRSNPILFFYS
eukprot:m.14418 g.14418  ORF g.14418 m.14418 type:complete len:491 (+) comp25746_c0_seq2:96-1568(+)